MSIDPFDDVYRLCARTMLPWLAEADAIENLRNLHNVGAFSIVFKNGKPAGLQMVPGVMREKAAQQETEAILGNLAMERKVGTSLHSLRDAIAQRDLANFEARPIVEVYTPAILEIMTDPIGAFVIEHNWAAAFASADLGEAPEVKLPYPTCCFEFRLSGHNVCAVLSEAHGLTVLIETRRGWFNIDPTVVGFPFGGLPKATAEPLRKFILGQVEAILVAIDADVVEASRVDAPEKLNKARIKKGRAPVTAYHVVRLAKARIAGTDAAAPSDRQSPRLHFRRGHWRTTESGRIWINWTLVGDPDLGFIEKHYRL